MKLASIWRYPVKSLSGEALEKTVLNPGLGLPHDRRWALANAHGEAFDNAEWHPKSQFLVLVREFALAKLKCRFDEASGTFTINGPNGMNIKENLNAPEGRDAIARAIAQYLGIAKKDTPRLVQAKSLGYVDAEPVSILNMASHRDLEKILDLSLEPERFRMNFWIEGAKPWMETQWLGKRIQIGKTILQITRNTNRCKATHVNPNTGDADVKVLHALKKHFGHTHMGVYATIEHGGPVQTGDPVRILD